MREGWTKGPQAVHVDPHLKTPHSYRSIAVDAETLAALESHRRAQLERRLEEGPAWRDQDLVFPGRHGKAQAPDNITHAWRTRVLKMDVPTIRLHDLRHTHVSIALAQGTDIRTLADRMGHDPVTMLRVYAHLLPNAQQAVAERFAAALLLPADEGAAHG